MLLLVAITPTIVCLTIRKWKGFHSNQTVKYSSNDKITTDANVAYKPVLHTATVNAEFEGTTEPQRSTKNLADSKLNSLNIEQNVAYTSSSNTTQTHVSLTSNVAYYKSGIPKLEEDYYENDQTECYDYIKAS